MTVNLPVRSLDARYYTDPEIFKLEQQGLLARALGSMRAMCRKLSMRATSLLLKSPAKGFSACVLETMTSRRITTFASTVLISW